MRMKTCPGCHMWLPAETGWHRTGEGELCIGGGHACSDWVRSSYERWLAAGGPDLWEWLGGKGPLEPAERRAISAVRRSLIDADSAESPLLR